MDCVLDLVTFVEDERHKGNMTVAVFLDIRRAFETVSHAKVWYGFLNIGVRKRILHLLSEFF